MAVKQVRWNLFIPTELLDRTKELAERKGVSASVIVRTAMEKYLAAVQRAEEARNAPK
jgi:predicted DNA-binding protein